MFSATKQMKRMQGHGCWKASFSVREVANAILRVKLKYMKDVSFSWNKCYLHAEDRFSWVRAFCRASHVRASMQRINIRASRTLMLCLVQLSKWREYMATDAEKLLSQWEKVA